MKRVTIGNIFGSAFIAAAALAGGCFGNGNGTSGDAASSGDPEADRRAGLTIGKDSAAANDRRTLYERLGGESKITALVDDLTARVIADPRVNFERKNVTVSWTGAKHDGWQATPENVERFKKHMTEFLTLAAGGPSEYTGREMAAVHKGMRITNSEFDAMIGDIKVSMDNVKLGRREARELLAIVETTRKQIVEKQ
jgi:hemoglobin